MFYSCKIFLQVRLVFIKISLCSRGLHVTFECIFLLIRSQVAIMQVAMVFRLASNQVLQKL